MAVCSVCQNFIIILKDVERFLKKIQTAEIWKYKNVMSDKAGNAGRCNFRSTGAEIWDVNLKNYFLDLEKTAFNL